MDASTGTYATTFRRTSGGDVVAIADNAAVESAELVAKEASTEGSVAENEPGGTLMPAYAGRMAEEHVSEDSLPGGPLVEEPVLQSSADPTSSADDAGSVGSLEMMATGHTPEERAKDNTESAEYCIRMVLMGASDLVAADESGLSDPFATIELVDITHRRHMVVKHAHSKKKYSHTSKIMYDTLDPIWDEHLKWEGIRVNPEKLALKVRLFDADMLGDMLVSTDPLGEIEVPVDQLPVDSDAALSEDNWLELGISPNMYAIKGSINFRAMLHEFSPEEQARRAAEKKSRHERHVAKQAAEQAEAVEGARRKKRALEHRRKQQWIKRKEYLKALTDSMRHSVLNAFVQAWTVSAQAIASACHSCTRVCRRDAATVPGETEVDHIAEAVEALLQEVERLEALEEQQKILEAEKEREAKRRAAKLWEQNQQEKAQAQQREKERLAKLHAKTMALWIAAGEFALEPVDGILASATQMTVEYGIFEYEKKLKLIDAKKEAAAHGDEEALRYMVEVWTADALNGSIEAQVMLGDAFMRGRGVEADREQALRWWTMSAAQGHHESQQKVLGIWAKKAQRGEDGSKWMYHMGHVFETGLYVEVDITKALAWYNKALKKGHAGARNRALACEMALAAQGDSAGQLHLGTSYWNGDGVPENKVTAVEWWTKAAEQQNADAEFYLGCATHTGEGMPGGEPDAEGAVVWFQRAADKQHFPAQKMLAKHWREQARKGDTESQIHLGKAYMKGRGVKRSMDKALMWWGEAAALKSQTAMLLLADVYYNAQGTTKNKARGLEWWDKAAKLGNTEAQYLAGKAHAFGGGCVEGEEGDGVVADNQKAVWFWRSAAENGHSSAQFSLGNAYFYGSGIVKDHTMAKHWWSQSSQLGNTDAEHMLDIASRHDEHKHLTLGLPSPRAGGEDSTAIAVADGGGLFS